jgi:hypothetical protein
MSDQNNLTKASGGDSKFELQSLAFGQRIGLKTDSSETTLIKKAIDALVTVPPDLGSILDKLFKTSDKDPNFSYDPTVKWLASLALTYNVLSLEVLLVDGEFYGLLIKVSGEKDQPFTGLELEVIYRKISDHLGEFSADLTLPDKFRKFKMGAGEVTLPIISISVWTNGDFKVNIGWPLGDRSFNIAFPPDPIPWAGGGGLYFAKLRSGDMPGLGDDFNPIIEFGIGLRLGAATSGDVGVLSYAASIYFFGTFQGFLAWRSSSSFADGLDYYWFCASVGITGHLEGSVDFVVISVSVSLDITASVTLALETGHRTYAEARFTAEVEASIKILFIRIHFSFSLDVSTSITFGPSDEPVALISGPTPPSNNLLRSAAEPAALVGELFAQESFSVQSSITLEAMNVPFTAQLYFLLQPSIRFDGQKWLPVNIASLIIGRSPVDVTLTAAAAAGATSISFSALNSALPSGTLLNFGNGKSAATTAAAAANATSITVAALPVALNAGDSATIADSFSQLVASLAAYILQNFGNYTDPNAVVTADNLTALDTALNNNEFNLQSIYSWLNGSANFTLSGATSAAGSIDGAIFPMVPGLTLNYNNQSTLFGDDAPPQDYLTTLKDYFKALSLIGDGSFSSDPARALFDAAPVSAETWMPGMIFSDYFNILAKQISKELCDLIPKGKYPPATQTPGTLAADLALINTNNMAGIVTRFLQHGLRLPNPTDTDNLLPVFELTGQQFDLELDVNNKYILDAALTGKARVNVSITGDGSASLPFALDAQPVKDPNNGLWNPQPLDRIKYVPLSFLLRQGLSWTEQVSATKNTNRLMYGFPDTLQSQLRAQGSLELFLNSISGTNSDGTPILKPSDGLGGLLINFSLTPIPKADGSGNIDFIYKVAGTDDATRDLMEILFALPGDMKNIAIEMLLPADSGGYTSSTPDDASTILLKTNLSTDNQPNAAAFFTTRSLLAAEDLPSLGATSASISTPGDFLLLLWECSVVHSGGFYIYIPDCKTTTPQSFDVALLVRSADAASSDITVKNYQNTILIDKDASNLGANDRVQVAVFDSHGVALTEPKPNYPAGTLAFGATWSNPPSDVTFAPENKASFATALYQLLQFQIAGGKNLQTSGWSMPLGPDGDANTWNYRRAVPIYRFVDGAQNPPNRYGAIGIAANVNLQLIDVFGNASPLNPLQLTAVYNDPLIPVDEWQGAYILYSFNTRTNGTAELNLNVSFNPEQVTQDQKATAYAYYQIICDQLTDPRASIAVTTAVAADAVSLKTPGGVDTQAALATFVEGVLAYLAPQSQAAPPADITLSGDVSIDYISKITEDMFPLWVSLTTTRTPVENDSFNYPDGFLSVVSQLPPKLDTVPDATTPNPAALRNWSIDFEQAFYNFDGAQGLLKVLSGAPPSKVTATKSMLGKSLAGAVTSTPGNLWALKWSENDGVSVSFANAGAQQQQAVYFAPLPLSTKLVSGSVPINTYDTTSGASTGTKTNSFNGVDLDGMGRSFLQAMDNLLSPELAAAVAQLNSDTYGKLMTAKEELAYAISSSISWVFQNQKDANAGDIESAKTRFRENLLSSLGSDFATSVIVQMPATVTVKNQFESDGSTSRAPEFFGNPTPSNDSSNTSTALNQYTISTAALPIKDGSGNLNFLVEALDPSAKADLRLDFKYDLAFIDHQFETSEEKFGYTPSSWLRFVVPDQDPKGVPTDMSPVLDVSMGSLDIPIPLRAYPTPPRLISQAATATNPTPSTIEDALKINYDLTIARPQVAQDDLHIALEFNGAQLQQSFQAADVDPFFAALANFQSFQTEYMPIATQIITGKISSSLAQKQQWLADIAEEVQTVADAWKSKSGTQPLFESAAEDYSSLPKPFQWNFMLQVQDEQANPLVVLLNWAGDGPPSFPLINNVQGQSVKATPGYQFTNQYALPVDSDDTLILSWQGLPLITNQSISTEAWIERNETLSGSSSGNTTNPDFVYTTSVVTFTSPVIPLVEVPGTITLTASNVNDAVSQLVTQAMQPAVPATQVGWSLQVDYSFVLVSQPGNAAQQLKTRLPVFLVKTAVGTGSNPAAPVQTPDTLIKEITDALVSWHQDFHPSDNNASVLFALTLFAANSQQSIARLLDIESPTNGWWQQ